MEPHKQMLIISVVGFTSSITLGFLTRFIIDKYKEKLSKKNIGNIWFLAMYLVVFITLITALITENYKKNLNNFIEKYSNANVSFSVELEWNCKDCSKDIYLKPYIEKEYFIKRYICRNCKKIIDIKNNK